ncbi:MAG: DUF6465 family protein [Lachnospiraceae bacterium]
MATCSVKKKVVLETGNNQYDVEKVTAAAIADYKKSNKAAMKDINVYIKPEDGKVYYTVNNNAVNGSVDL